MFMKILVKNFNKSSINLIFAIVQVVETFLNIRIRFPSVSIMMCDRQADCCNLSPKPMLYSVNWIAIFSKIML